MRDRVEKEHTAEGSFGCPLLFAHNSNTEVDLRASITVSAINNLTEGNDNAHSVLALCRDKSLLLVFMYGTLPRRVRKREREREGEREGREEGEKERERESGA